MSGKTKKDEVRDEQGRRRFHGAFTGGFSAGHYNTVGSVEGWTPSTFQSSRSSRASARSQRPEDFMDDEDGLLGRDLEAQLPYDTLGDASQKILQAQAEKQAVGSAIPGIVVDELLAPTGVSIGKKLLQMMGWKEGVGVGSRQVRKRKGKRNEKDDSKDDNRGAAAGASEMDDDDAADFIPEHLRGSIRSEVIQQGKITFARPNIEVFKMPAPKDDLYGLGFDPDVHAPEFRALREAAKEDGDRGTYRMSDVVGKSTSSKAGPRNAMGFALDDDEDDVYDMDIKAGGGAKYDTEIRGFGQEDEDDEDEGFGRGAKSHRKALDAWIGGAGEGGEGHQRGLSRCPSDSRPVPEGFMLGLEQAALKQVFWPPPTPPRNFVPFHRFDKDEADHGAAIANEKDANRGRLIASSRGTLLGECKPPPLEEGRKPVASVFDLMSEDDRKRVLGGAAAVKASSGMTPAADASSGATMVEAEKAVPLVRNAAVSQGMQGALSKRFSVVEVKPPADARKEGLTEGGYAEKPADNGGGAGGASAGGLQPPPKEPTKDPTRSQSLWYPSALLCKRFGVPVPQHAKFTPASQQQQQQQQQQRVPGRPAGAESQLSNKFEKEMDALLPGGGKTAQETLILDEEPVEEDEGAGAGAPKEVELPSFEETPRPPMDFFKAIFEASDDDDEDEDSDEDEEKQGETGKKKATEGSTGGGGEGETKAARKGPSWAAPPPTVSKEEAAKLSGDAPTPTDLSPARDYFLQPAADESIEAILAKGPVFTKKERKRKEPESDEGSDGEGTGLVFGAAVIKKKKPKTAKAAVTKQSAVEPEEVDAADDGAKGISATPPLPATKGEVPPTPPRMEVDPAPPRPSGGGAAAASVWAPSPPGSMSSDDSSISEGEDDDMGPTPSASSSAAQGEKGQEKSSKKRKKEHKKHKDKKHKDRKRHKEKKDKKKDKKKRSK